MGPSASRRQSWLEPARHQFQVCLNLSSYELPLFVENDHLLDGFRRRAVWPGVPDSADTLLDAGCESDFGHVVFLLWQSGDKSV